MFIRACCLSFLCVSLTTGCQTPATALFPWMNDSSDPESAKSDLKSQRDELSLIPDPASDTMRRTPAEIETFKDTQHDNMTTEHAESWLQQGHEALLQAQENARPEAMLSEARHSFREALKINPQRAEAFHGLAIVSDLSRDWELADISYKRALEIRPNDANLLNDQGFSYLLQNRYHEATQYLNRALEVSPGHEKAHVNLAILNIRRGHQEAALVHLENVYPEGLARNALTTLTEQHVLITAGGDHRTPLDPVDGSDTLLAEPQTPQQMFPVTHTPWNGALQEGELSSGQRRLTEPDLVSQNGLSRRQPSQTPIHPAGGLDPELQPIGLSPTKMHPSVNETLVQTPPSVPSPLNSARTVGRTFHMPSEQPLRKTPLTPSGNGYSSNSTSDGFVQPSSRVQVSAQLPAPNTNSAPLFNRHPVPSRPLQYQQPFVQPHLGQQSQRQPVPGHPHYHGTGGINDLPLIRSLPAPVLPASDSGNSADLSPQTGSFYPNRSPATETPRLQNNPNQQGVNSPYGTPLVVSPSHKLPVYPQEPVQQRPVSPKRHGAGIVYPAGWAHSTPGSGVRTTVAGRHVRESPRQPQPYGFSPPVSTVTPVTPGHFSQPSVASPDQLTEYRKTRRQPENEYNQTLKQIGQPIGGQSIP